MLTYYVDLEATSDGNGSTGSPFTEAQAQAQNESAGEAVTFILKGAGTITFWAGMDIAQFERKFEAWDISRPPTISGFDFANLSLTLNGLIITNSGVSADCSTLITNCLFVNCGFRCQPKSPPFTTTIKGCTFYASTQLTEACRSALGNAGNNILIDSCYFDGPIIKPISVYTYEDYQYEATVGYCGVYNNQSFTTLVTISPVGAIPITDLGGHVLQKDLPSQITYPFTNLPGDLQPDSSSYLATIGGDPDLGLDADIFGTARAQKPTIGCAEAATVSYLKLYDILIQPSRTKAGRFAGIRQNIYDTCVLKTGNILANKEDIKKVELNFLSPSVLIPLVDKNGNFLHNKYPLSSTLTPNALQCPVAFNSKAPIGTWPLATCVVQNYALQTMTLVRSDFGDLSDFVLLA